jgi:gluconokinase
VVIVLIGPAGAGKTTVGTALAHSLGWRFVDADDFHSPENRARLAHGDALSDADRAPWLASLRREIERAIEHDESIVLACSALRRSYRAALRPPSKGAAEQVRFVYLRASVAQLDRRLRTRVGHFAPPALLESQLETLEEPFPEEGVLTVDGERPVGELVAGIRRATGQ